MNFTSILVLILYGGIALLEIPQLRKEKDKGKLILYVSLLILSAASSLLIGMGIKLPSPSDPIKQFVTSIFGE